MTKNINIMKINSTQSKNSKI